MKAVAVNPSKRKVGLIEREEPRLAGATQVKVRILDVGVCGTDREICQFEYGTPPEGADALVIGHESLGVVVETGSAVSRVKTGDLVVPMVRRPCPHDTCQACRAGRQDFCYTGDFRERGIKGADGFMTDLIVDDEIYMNVVPKALRRAAVLVEPLTIAEKALMQVAQIQKRLPWACPIEAGHPPAHCRRAVVLGAGPVGLLGAMALVNVGFDTYVYSRTPAPNPKASLVDSLGAHYVSSLEETPAQLAARMGSIDLVYEAVGASRAAFEMMTALGTNGIFIFTGVPGRKAPVELDTDLLMRNLVLKNQVVFGSVNAGRDAFEAAIADLGMFQSRWPSAVAGLITGRFAPAACEELLLAPASGIKNVIAFSEAV